MRTLPALLLAAWALAAVPALCVAGVLAHGCPCEEEPACGHETDCDVDPCAELVARTDESVDLASQEGGAASALLPAEAVRVRPAPSASATPPPRSSASVIRPPAPPLRI